MNPNLAVVVPVVSAVVAAVVSLLVVFLSRRSETIKHLQSLRITAYVDFIRAVAGLGVLQHEAIQSKEHFVKGGELRMLLADAKSRIAIYGSESVVSALARFLRGGKVLDSPERARAFTAVCQQMRTDTRPKLGKVSDSNMHFLLFDYEIKDYLD